MSFYILTKTDGDKVIINSDKISHIEKKCDCARIVMDNGFTCDFSCSAEYLAITLDIQVIYANV